MRARPALWGEGIGNDPSYPAPNDMSFLSTNIAHSEGKNREKQREETGGTHYRTGLQAIGELRRKNCKLPEGLSAT